MKASGNNVTQYIINYQVIPIINKSQYCPMNLIHCLNQDLHENSLEALLGLSSSSSSISSESQVQYNFGMGFRECETYQWIWKDENIQIQTTQKLPDLQVCEMTEARVDQQNRIKQYMSWVSASIPNLGANQQCKAKKRIKKLFKKNK